MNLQLEKLFDTYNFSLKDRHEFLQIFSLLPSNKKVTALENFPKIAAEIGLLREDLVFQQEVLFGKALSKIEDRIQNMKSQDIFLETKLSIQQLRQQI